MTDAQRLRIASGRVAGRTAKRIARETGLAQKTVERQLADPRTVTQTLRLKHQKAPQIERIFGLTLNSLERDVKSKNRGVCAMARAQFLRLLPLGDPPLLRIAPADNSGGDFTLEELLACYRKAVLGG